MDWFLIMDVFILLMDDCFMLFIIEDNVDVIEYIECLLQKDYFVKSVCNGEDGIQEVLCFIFDIIISDIMMLGKNGYEVCDYLKNNS